MVFPTFFSLSLQFKSSVEALYREQKQDRELTVTQIARSLHVVQESQASSFLEDGTPLASRVVLEVTGTC